MGLVVLRERYTLLVEGTPEGVLRALRAHMRRSNPADLKVRVTQKPDSFVLRFPSHASQIGTPQLDIDLELVPRGLCRVTVTLGPSPLGWRLLRGGAFLSGGLALAGIAWAFLQWSNGGMAWGTYMFMAGLGTWLFLYFFAEDGKRRNRDRIGSLKSFVEGALQVPLHEERSSRSGHVPAPSA